MLMTLLQLLGVCAYIVAVVAGFQQGSAAAWAAGLATCALAIALVGFVNDIFYNRSVRAGTAEYRLPFWLRWEGWSLGSLEEDGEIFQYRDFLNRKYYDPRFDKVVDIYHFFPMERAPKTS